MNTGGWVAALLSTRLVPTQPLMSATLAAAFGQGLLAALAALGLQIQQ